MLIDEIKKGNIEAMKAHDQNARSVYSILLSRYMEKKTSGEAKEITDADVLAMIQKLCKELDEEKESYLKVAREEQAKAIDAQKAALTKYLPKQLSEEEIRTIILSLSDKSVPAVMKHFKAHYAGQCDMGLVSKIARNC